MPLLEAFFTKNMVWQTTSTLKAVAPSGFILLDDNQTVAILVAMNDFVGLLALRYLSQPFPED